MKSKLIKHLKNKMGLVIVNGEIVDMYGRILETYTDSKGCEDLKPTGRVCRDMTAFNAAKRLNN